MQLANVSGSHSDLRGKVSGDTFKRSGDDGGGDAGCAPSHSRPSAALCVFKNSPARPLHLEVSVVCLFDTPMSRPQLADCSRSYPLTTPPAQPPLQRNAIVQRALTCTHPPPLRLSPFMLTLHFTTGHRSTPHPPAKQCQADLFFSTPPLCHPLIIPESHGPLL